MSPPSSSERWPQRANGFTLLEVLVAVSVVAIVLVTVYGIFNSVSLAKERVERDGEVYHRVRIVYDRFGRELRGVCPVGGPEQQGVFRTGRDTDGNPTLEITTTAVTQQGLGQTGVALVRYTLAPNLEKGTGKQLLRTEQAALAGDENGQPSGPMRLAAGIDQMEWRFLVQDQWRNELDVAQDGLPLLVELTLTMTDASGRQLPFRSAFELPDIGWRSR